MSNGEDTDSAYFYRGDNNGAPFWNVACTGHKRKVPTFADNVISNLKYRMPDMGSIMECDIREAIKNAGG
jgi:hypothetical protein